jgi:hypothetical protein
VGEDREAVDDVEPGRVQWQRRHQLVLDEGCAGQMPPAPVDALAVVVGTRQRQIHSRQERAQVADQPARPAAPLQHVERARIGTFLADDACEQAGVLQARRPVARPVDVVQRVERQVLGRDREIREALAEAAVRGPGPHPRDQELAVIGQAQQAAAAQTTQDPELDAARRGGGRREGHGRGMSLRTSLAQATARLAAPRRTAAPRHDGSLQE